MPLSSQYTVSSTRLSFSTGSSPSPVSFLPRARRSSNGHFVPGTEMTGKTAAPELADTLIQKPVSQAENPDTPYLQAVQKGLGDTPQGRHEFQKFRSLYNQMMMPTLVRRIFPAGMVGIFCLLMVMLLVSTDDSRIFNASSCLFQDVILPFFKERLSPEKHLLYLRLMTLGVGVFFLIVSLLFSNMDYINMFTTIMCALWTGGAGPIMVFGLYSRFGNLTGAWCAIIFGSGHSLFGLIMQHNWALTVYPFLEQMGWVEGLNNFLVTVSSPFNPWISWSMNPVKYPINSYEITFIAICVSITLYILVSKLTCKEPFNLERMLHRGKYAVDGESKPRMKWTLKNVFAKLIGITPEYSKGDKVIAYVLFCYSIIYRFFLMFIAVLIWNAISPWPSERWGNYFFISLLLIPCIVAAITAVWFGVGGFINLIQLFRDLKQRVVNPLDNGRVEGNMSLADKAQLEAADKKK